MWSDTSDQIFKLKYSRSQPQHLIERKEGIGSISVSALTVLIPNDTVNTDIDIDGHRSKSLKN